MRYQFVVEGPVGMRVLDQFPEFAVTSVPHGTAMFGPVSSHDDAQTIAARLVSLDLPVVDVRPLPD